MLEDLVPPPSSRSCRVGQILSELDEKDQAILQDALADSMRWSSHALMNALKSRGLPISIHPILNHRRGLCRCSKT